MERRKKIHSCGCLLWLTTTTTTTTTTFCSVNDPGRIRPLEDPLEIPNSSSTIPNLIFVFAPMVARLASMFIVIMRGSGSSNSTRLHSNFLFTPHASSPPQNQTLGTLLLQTSCENFGDCEQPKHTCRAESC
jgi:hypothetical protein